MTRKIILLLLLISVTINISYSLPNDFWFIVKTDVVSGTDHLRYVCLTTEETTAPSGICYGILKPTTTPVVIYMFRGSGNVSAPIHEGFVYLGPQFLGEYAIVLQSYGQGSRIWSPAFNIYTESTLARQLFQPASYFYSQIFPLDKTNWKIQTGIYTRSGAEAIIRYIALGVAPGDYIYFLGSAINLTAAQPIQPVECARPVIVITTPANGTRISSGSLFNLTFEFNTPTGYGFYDVLLDNTVIISGVGSAGTRRFTLQISGSGERTIEVRVGYRCGDSIIISSEYVRVIVTLPPRVNIISITPVASVPYPRDYPIISEKTINVSYVIQVYDPSIQSIPCDLELILESPAEITYGNTYKRISRTVSIVSTVTSVSNLIDMSDMAQGRYVLNVSCSIPGVVARDQIRFIYAYNASESSELCYALGGYYTYGNCCGDEPGESKPDQVTGYPNPTYFITNGCRLEAIPQGKCLINLDCPPPGYICLNDTHRAYVTYSCTVNYSKINPTGFGDCVANTVRVEACPAGYMCSYGVCVLQPIVPNITINILSPRDEESIFSDTVNIRYNVSVNTQSNIICDIILNGITIKQRIDLPEVIEDTITVPAGRHTLTIQCSDIFGTRASATVRFNVNVTAYRISTECGIPYVCLSSIENAIVSFYPLVGRCGYDILSRRTANTGEYCVHGNIVNVSKITISDAIGYVCGPDAKTIYGVIYSPSAISMYQVGEAKNRCVLGKDVSDADLETFDGMRIPVCKDENTIVEYVLRYDKINKRLRYEEGDTRQCELGCVAGLCGFANIRKPILRIIEYPTSLVVGSKGNIKIYIEDPYPTAYVEVYDIYNPVDVVFKGVLPTNVENTIEYVPKSASEHTLRIIVTNALGISSEAILYVNITTAPTPGVPGVPGVPGIGLPVPAVIAREGINIVAAVVVLAIVVAVLYYLYTRR